ncbi:MULTISPECIES: AraC family transcriptional regulator [unclassified Exiguobacterium]|uniref:AraC family transcriptional regulator n=1 Tax=unclassified Exiguobacterium TaxID=2644629 RepID=UPI001BED13E0|nr:MULTISPECIES: AraC family transcriptional regulator [unclassified Exiguobacterium]
MRDQPSIQQAELASIIERHTGTNSIHETAIPSLSFVRRPIEKDLNYGVYRPSLCITAQGMKEVSVGMEDFRYGPGDYLVSSVDLPATSQLIETSLESPYLGFILELKTNEILEVLDNANVSPLSEASSERGMFVSRLNSSLFNAVLRLVRLLDTPDDIPMLAPLYTKEIIYKVLTGEHGNTLENIVVKGNSAHHIKKAIQLIMTNYDKPLRVDQLAETVNMNVSAFHKHFKEVAAMSPIQFQKQLKLQEARRLLLSETSDAATVAYRVGYESPSQFSREYSRLFGLPPREDIKRLKEKHEQRLNH